MALHHWWTKEYAEHKGHLQAHTGPIVDISRQSLVRRVAAQLDGIGWEKAKEIDLAFGSVMEMVMADERDFAMLKGIGKTLSRSIVDQLRGD
jgi:ERCC4-type nuclease